MFKRKIFYSILIGCKNAGFSFKKWTWPTKGPKMQSALYYFKMSKAHQTNIKSPDSVFIMKEENEKKIGPCPKVRSTTLSSGACAMMRIKKKSKRVGGAKLCVVCKNQSQVRNKRLSA